MTGTGTSDQQWHACCATWVMRPSVEAITPSRPDSPPPAPPAMAVKPEKSSPAEKARPSAVPPLARTAGRSGPQPAELVDYAVAHGSDLPGQVLDDLRAETAAL